MPETPLPFTIRELRQRYLQEAEYCSADLLLQMKTDPRRGVREIYRQLLQRQEREKEENQRLDRMLSLERRLWTSGMSHVAGMDEAGIGPLAGPVIAAAVIFSPRTRISGVDDSKKLGRKQRSVLATRIKQEALSVSIGISEVWEIDRVNVYQAGLLAMKRAVSGLSIEPEHVLVDGRFVPGLAVPQKCLIKGDRRSFTIAAASIIAKTHRDRLMQDLDKEFPGYGFSRNNGYGTAGHREALRRLGPAPPHRRSFSLLSPVSAGLFDDLR